jgi:hypothetical protein
VECVIINKNKTKLNVPESGELGSGNVSTNPEFQEIVLAERDGVAKIEPNTCPA